MLKDQVVVICADPLVTRDIAHGIVSHHGGPRRDKTFSFFKAPSDGHANQRLRHRHHIASAHPYVFPVTQVQHDSLPFFHESVARRFHRGGSVDIIGIGSEAADAVGYLSDVAQFRNEAPVTARLITDTPQAEGLLQTVAERGITLVTPFSAEHLAKLGAGAIKHMQIDAMPRGNADAISDYKVFQASDAQNLNVKFVLNDRRPFAFAVLEDDFTAADARFEGQNLGLRMKTDTNLILAHAGHARGGSARAEHAMFAFSEGYWNAQADNGGESYIARLPVHARETSYYDNVGAILRQTAPNCVEFMSAFEENVTGHKAVRQIVEALDLTHRRGVIRRPAFDPRP